MNPIPFPQANTVLRSPPGVPEERCRDLPIHRSANGVVSCWMPTRHELALLVMGNPVYLVVNAPTHPALSIVVDAPFVEPMTHGGLAEIKAGASACLNCRYAKIEDAILNQGMIQCSKWEKQSPLHYECEAFEQSPTPFEWPDAQPPKAQAAEEPKACTCGHDAPEIHGNGIGDYFVECPQCHRRSDQRGCESKALAIHRWNWDLMEGDDFEA
jgi:hypothetical protein